MRVLIINVNSHEGSVGKIAHGLLDFLTSRGDECILACSGPRESPVSDKRIVKLNTKWSFYFSVMMTKLVGYEGLYNKYSTDKLLRLIDDFNPDVVQLYNLHGYWIDHYRVLEALKRRRVSTVYSMLDEFPYLGICFFVSYPDYCDKYQTECRHCPHHTGYNRNLFFDQSEAVFKRKKRIYSGFSNIVFTGPEYVTQRAKMSALTRDNRIETLNEPIDYAKVFYPHDTGRLRSELGIPDGNKVVVTVADDRRPRKGGAYFVDTARRLVHRKDITFVFVGCRRKSEELPPNMIPVSYVRSQDALAQYYSLADLFVCCSLADTTPNTCLEAMGCGSPLAGFREGGIPYCAPEGIGTYVDTLDTQALAEVVARVTLKTPERIAEVRAYALAHYSFPVVFSRLYDIYKSLLAGRPVGHAGTQAQPARWNVCNEKKQQSQ